ncbi:NUDIX domain protein [Aminobacter sp. MSH1]|uniref:NUDIX hydrolase n=1 Tax=Aminobacter sp. MSH1 TaxID=374606 RepID=UPI000D3A9C36|nr:NUDIX hydrolase [Aminobacter sp. MSH1]AWC22139.1 NUDIX domain protein [Aminobacter sp. MSH1]
MPKDKKTIRKANKGEIIAQVAAIPFRVNEAGELEVMLVTSRGTRRFIVPKGWPMKGKSGRQAALIEAREEAGVRGKALKRPAGSYCYWKRLSTSFVHVEVTAYLIDVSEELDAWQEAGVRQRAWLTPSDAAVLIDEPELSTLIRGLTVADLVQPEAVLA